jgi:dienelactone hydrolase
MTSWTPFWALVAALCAGCAPSLKELKPALEAADSGNIWFATAGSLNRSSDGARFVPGDPVAISGELRFPSGPGPFPAVILAHGCNGNGQNIYDWATALRDWGYATFVLDSFSARGLTEVCSNARALTSTQRIPDAYGALRILATHPKIDARRIALMGFSHGGGLTMGAATEWAKETYAPPGRPAFRTFLPFYPNCTVGYPEADHLSAPLRIHHGERDDWLPAASCVRLVDALKASGQDAAITVYPGAYHSFDNKSLPVRRLPNVDNPAGCEVRVPSILALALPSMGSCMRKGATVGGSAEATEQAYRNVRAQLAELLKGS